MGVTLAILVQIFSLALSGELDGPLRNDLPPFIRARAIRTQGEEPAVRLQPIFVPIPEPRKAPARRVEVREDLA